MASRTQAQVEPSPQPSVARAKILQAVQQLSQSSEDVQDSIMEAILSAETEEELFAVLDQSTVDARSRLGIPLRVLGVKLNASSIANSSLPGYCVIECVNHQTGKTELVTCGAGTVVAGLVKMHELNLFPMDLVLFERPESSNGFKPIAFRRATAEQIKDAGDRF